MSDLASKASYTASTVVTVGGGVTLNEFVAVAGIFLALGTFLVNWRYKHLHYKMEKERSHESAQDTCN